MSQYEKPVPKRTDLNAPFMDGSLEGKLRLQRSVASGEVRFPPTPRDPATLSLETEWVDLSGRATLWSWTIFHQGYFPSFRDELPYPVIMVKLEEGPLMIATVPADVDVSTFQIDMPLMVEFEPATEDFAVAKFRPVAS